nr:AAA family ATPase [Leptospiraceae bacterium]
MLTIANFTIEETLYESSKSIVFRAKNESGYKIIKLLNSEYPSPVDIGRYKLEFEIASLFDSPHVIKYYTLEKYNNAYYIVIEDFNAISLKEYNSKYPTDIKDFLSIAIKICESIKVIHSKNIIHKDINPKNILINPVTKELKITDFDIASSIPKENKRLQSVDRMEGTINYISPEQTGRMNRALDSRSDLYSLGVTFYEMLTGKLPFYSLDTMEMVYYHITKTPIPPIDKKSQVPRIISDIVMKLLSKNAEERYATIQGLQFDLTQCLNNLTNISEFSFTIGMNDISEKLSIPQKLYGREKELQILVDSFQKACQGSNEVLLINGYSGIGKTSLVKELHNNLTQTKGLFLTGKFDQLKQNTPYLPFIQAFSDAFEYILAEKEENLIRWRKKISEKIGNNASLLLEFFPRLKQILNDIPVIDELSPEEAQNRFYHTFLSLVSVFCSKENPLILFLDDWQWSDSGSQKILHKIVTENY